MKQDSILPKFGRTCSRFFIGESLIVFLLPCLKRTQRGMSASLSSAAQLSTATTPTKLLADALEQRRQHEQSGAPQVVGEKDDQILSEEYTYKQPSAPPVVSERDDQVGSDEPAVIGDSGSEAYIDDISDEGDAEEDDIVGRQQPGAVRVRGILGSDRDSVEPSSVTRGVPNSTQFVVPNAVLVQQETVVQSPPIAHASIVPVEEEIASREPHGSSFGGSSENVVVMEKGQIRLYIAIALLVVLGLVGVIVFLVRGGDDGKGVEDNSASFRNMTGGSMGVDSSQLVPTFPPASPTPAPNDISVGSPTLGIAAPTFPSPSADSDVPISRPATSPVTENVVSPMTAPVAAPVSNPVVAPVAAPMAASIPSVLANPPVSPSIPVAVPVAVPIPQPLARPSPRPSPRPTPMVDDDAPVDDEPIVDDDAPVDDEPIVDDEPVGDDQPIVDDGTLADDGVFDESAEENLDAGFAGDDGVGDDGVGDDGGDDAFW